MNIDKFTVLTLAAMAYLLPFSTRFIGAEYLVVGTEVINDFTRVFVFGVDLAVILTVLALLYLNRGCRLADKKTLTALGLFLLWCLLVVIYKAVPEASLLSWVALSRLMFAGLIFIEVLKIPSQLSFPAISVGLIISGVVQSVIAITQFGLQKSVGLYVLGESPLMVGQAGIATFATTSEKLLRAYGTLPHPNILAFFLSISLMATIVALISQPRFKKYLLPALFLTAVGLILTFSRLFIFLTVITLAVYFFLNRKGLSKKLTIPAFAILALVLIFIAQLRPIASDSSLNLRNLYSETYLELSAQYKLTGTGLGQSVLVANKVIQNEFTNNYQPWMHQPAHNTYLVLRTEIGWVGLGLFFLFLIYVTENLRAKLKNSPTPTLVFSSLVVVLILVGMFWEHLFITNPNSLYLSFLMLGVLAKAKQNE